MAGIRYNGRYYHKLIKKRLHAAVAIQFEMQGENYYGNTHLQCVNFS